MPSLIVFRHLASGKANVKTPAPDPWDSVYKIYGCQVPFRRTTTRPAVIGNGRGNQIARRSRDHITDWAYHLQPESAR